MILFILNGRDRFEGAREAAGEISDWLRQVDYDAVLDDKYEPFTISCSEIEASFILKRDSLGVYLRGFYDWVSEKADEYRLKLESLGHGDKAMINGIMIECKIDEENEYEKAA